MITQSEIEALAAQMAEPCFACTQRSIQRLIGHLDEEDFYAVLRRGGEISRDQTADAADADPVTLAEAEIEMLGNQLADDWSKDKEMSELTAGLYGANLDAVLNRAELISFRRSGAYLADSAETLLSLARATSCPDDVAIIPWLQKRGLVEEVDGGWRFKKPKPGSIK